ncbi:alkylation response protein AidB-like acyl-CoA dehydrogenase [Sphingomonas jinjuensis]|uniref:Alkylation response protein AidB-like acyl-CoA dehydrogenase n=1 Tax=Sphingomonas jinjuensis TaxID=535907 RepID=A0A840FMD2_9SPHN|nr:acyl-CoA dehydrogenase family protein [Sphingomonas jinjuensis]MBB4155088.1 alkylation response protein AidB-like acyl-CoA dehydrogenase [Sphingomonas jinjuensis]
MSDADLDLLSESFADLLRAEWPIERAVAFASGDPAAISTNEGLQRSVIELGWPALTIAEEHGGLGLSRAAMARLYLALGAAVAPVPMLDTTLAAALIGDAGTPAQRERWLPLIASGSVRASISQPAMPALRCDGARMSGHARGLLDGGAANLFLLAAERRGRRGWVAIEASAAGVLVVPRRLVDPSRSAAEVVLDEVAVEDDAWILPPDPGRVADHLLRHAAIALAADALGAAESALASVIDYLKTRQQFGKVIGSFQALKHRLADHSTALVGARELLAYVAAMDDEDHHGLLNAISAKAQIARVAADVTRDCIQLFGGIGFTAEHPAHLYLKRAKLDEALFETGAGLLDRVADLLEAA